MHLEKEKVYMHNMCFHMEFLYKKNHITYFHIYNDLFLAIIYIKVLRDNPCVCKELKI